MNNNSMNFTGKSTLTDAEFFQNYEQLWEKSPHENNWPSKEEIAERKREGAKRYNSEADSLPGEEWRMLPNDEHYFISTMGRVKYNDAIVPQDDTERMGYLKLDVEKKLNVDHYVNVYTLVAKAFLGKKEGDGYDVHHIDNNGYDNRPENLILLTRTQHNAVHRDEKLSQEELKAFLEQTEL
ncbi:MAG: HNH endonuclease [Treponemataceae bacterium]|nr:HNH endonuclease [Treponemataceae bacterium]